MPGDLPENEHSEQVISYEIGDYSYDISRKLLLQPHGESVKLRPKSKQVLEELLKNNGSAVTRDTFAEAVWGRVFVTDDALTQCIKEIRLAIRDDDKTLLQTIPKIGYTLYASPQHVSKSPETPRIDRTNWKTMAAIGVLFVVTAIFLLYRFSTHEPETLTERTKHITVQQFQSLSDDERWNRLAFGLSLEIASVLSSNNLLTVHTVNETESVPSNFDGFVLRGALLPDDDNNLHVSAQLLDAASSNEVVWTNRWDRPLTDFFKIQAEIVSGIDTTLAPFWSGSINKHITKKSGNRDRNLTAYELYLKGVEEKHKFEPESYQKAEKYLRQALEIDPSFSEAWTTLAVVYLNLGINAHDTIDRKLYSEKRADAAIRGYELAPDNPDTLVQWSWLKANQGKWEESETAMRKAVQNAGTDGDILAVAALAGSQYVALGDDAFDWSKRAIHLRTPYPIWYNLAAGISAFHADRYEISKNHLLLAPDMAQKHLYLAATYMHLDDASSAKNSVLALKAINSAFTVSGYSNSVSMGPAQRSRLQLLTESAGVPSNKDAPWIQPAAD